MYRLLRQCFAIFLLLAFFLVSLLLSKWLQRHVLFMHLLNIPWGNLTQTENYGFAPGRARSFFIQSTDGIKIGAWLIRPRSWRHDVGAEATATESTAPLGRGNSTVFLFFHGNAGNRGTKLRLACYNGLAATDPEAHILAIDYRGFGDSDCATPTEKGLLADAQSAWKYLLDKNVHPSRIVIAGLSLGSGVAVQLAVSTAFGVEQARGLLMIASYSSIAETVWDYPFLAPLRLFRVIPGIEQLVGQQIVDKFNSTSYIGAVRVPILLLHGNADKIIPSRHTHTLFRAATRNGLGIQESKIKHGAGVFYTGANAALGWNGNAVVVTFLELRDAGHNDLLDYEPVRLKVAEWLGRDLGHMMPANNPTQVKTEL